MRRLPNVWRMTATLISPYRWRWAGLVALLLAEAMNLLDSTVVQVAAPAIRADLGAADGQLQWLTAGYTLPFAVLLITCGRLGDIFGRRRVFVAGVVLFGVCSALCAIAPSMAVLLAARIGQGTAAALVVPQTFGLIRAMFTGAEVGRALGTIGPVMALSAVSGPVLGGVLTDANLLGLGWRPVFLINLPLTLAVLALTPLIREDRSPTAPRLDLTGTVLAAVAVGLLVYPLVEGNDAGWPGWTWACLLLGLTALAGFAVQQARRSRDPLVEPGLFRTPAFPASLLTAVLLFAVTTGLMFVLVLFFQLDRGITASGTALTLLPWPVGLALGSWAGGRLAARRTGRVMRAGLTTVLSGLAGTAWLLTAPAAVLAIPLLLTGFGLGVFTVRFFDNALAGVEHRETGSAAGLLNAGQQLGGTLGVAVLGAVFFHAGTRPVLAVAAVLIAAVLALTGLMTTRRASVVRG